MQEKLDYLVKLTGVLEKLLDTGATIEQLSTENAPDTGEEGASRNGSMYDPVP